MDTQTFFYIVGGALCVVALGISLIGIRSENFPPSRGTVLGGLGIVALVVITACAGAVLAAREEQKHRRAELAHVSEEDPAAPEGAAGDTESSDGQQEVPVAPSEETAPAEEAPAEEPAEEPSNETADIDAAALFDSNGCGSCHTFAAAGSQASVGPSLDEAIPGQTPETVLESIVDPEAEIADGFGGGIMPATFGETMSEEELDALVQYLIDNAG